MCSVSKTALLYIDRWVTAFHFLHLTDTFAPFEIAVLSYTQSKATFTILQLTVQEPKACADEVIHITLFHSPLGFDFLKILDNLNLFPLI